MLQGGVQMFLKLFKYDFISVIKKIVYYYIVLIAIAIFAKIIDLLLSGTKFEFISALPSMLYVGIMSSGLTVTLVLCMMRYYKNMLSDQGYLTHTLPVKRSHILLAKLLATLAIEAITALVMILSVVIYAANWIPDIITSIKNMFAEISVYPETRHIVTILTFILIICLLSTVFNVAYISLCLTLGATHNKNKLAMAFVYYMVINFVLQVFYIGIGVVGTLFVSSIVTEFSFSILYTILTLICVGEVVMIIIAYFVNLMFLNKKLNLE